MVNRDGIPRGKREGQNDTLLLSVIIKSKEIYQGGGNLFFSLTDRLSFRVVLR